MRRKGHHHNLPGCVASQIPSEDGAQSRRASGSGPPGRRGRQCPETHAHGPKRDSACETPRAGQARRPHRRNVGLLQTNNKPRQMACTRRGSAWRVANFSGVTKHPSARTPGPEAGPPGALPVSSVQCKDGKQEQRAKKKIQSVWRGFDGGGGAYRLCVRVARHCRACATPHPEAGEAPAPHSARSGRRESAENFWSGNLSRPPALATIRFQRRGPAALRAAPSSCHDEHGSGNAGV